MVANNSWFAVYTLCLVHIYVHRVSTLLQYCCRLYIATILYFTINYNTDTECARAIASTLIHACSIVLCESAQRYRALIVILQSHRIQNMILRCYPNVSAILRRHTKSCLLCFFKQLFNHGTFNISYHV